VGAFGWGRWEIVGFSDVLDFDNGMPPNPLRADA